MSLATQYGADRIWIVNVGHFKAYALPTEYFLDLAWDARRWTNDNINEYTRLWAEREFGAQYASQIADILAKYSKYNGRRKPELLEARTYSLVNHREWERVVEDFDAITRQAEALYERMPAHKRDAFYQLVLFPAKASATVNRMYYAAAQNALYAQQGRASANEWAQTTRDLFQADADLMAHFNTVLAGGKWQHFQDQSHIGYTTWRDPPQNSLAAVRLTEIEVPLEAAIGVAIEGSTFAWPGAKEQAVLPRFDALSRQRHYLDVFNRGRTPYSFTATASAPWILLDQSSGTVGPDTRLWVTIDWSRAPRGMATGSVRIGGAGGEVLVAVEALNPADVTRASLRGFAEGQGLVSIEPEHFTRRLDASAGRWIRIEDYGRTLSGMRAEAQAHAPSATPGTDSPVLEYLMHLFTPGEVATTLVLSPTLNFVPERGLRVAVSFDDEPPQIITIVPAKYDAANGNRDWEESVRNNARVVRTTHTIAGAGEHTLRIWMVDPAVVVQKIVVDTPASRRAVTYLGPPESVRGELTSSAAAPR